VYCCIVCRRRFKITTLFLIFNHSVTRLQEEDARRSLGVGRIVDLPAELKALWQQIPPDIPGIFDYLEPVREWLTKRAEEGDYVLVQGDFGACFLMAKFAMERGLVPVYSTTEREAREEHAADGTVELTHRFRHRIFRRYGE